MYWPTWLLLWEQVKNSHVNPLKKAWAFSHLSRNRTVRCMGIAAPFPEDCPALYQLRVVGTYKNQHRPLPPQTPTRSCITSGEIQLELWKWNTICRVCSCFSPWLLFTRWFSWRAQGHMLQWQRDQGRKSSGHDTPMQMKELRFSHLNNHFTKGYGRQYIGMLSFWHMPEFL